MLYAVSWYIMYQSTGAAVKDFLRFPDDGQRKNRPDSRRQDVREVLVNCLNGVTSVDARSRQLEWH